MKSRSDRSRVEVSLGNQKPRASEAVLDCWIKLQWTSRFEADEDEDEDGEGGGGDCETLRAIYLDGRACRGIA